MNAVLERLDAETRDKFFVLDDTLANDIIALLKDSPEYTGANLSAIFYEKSIGDETSEGLMLMAYLRAFRLKCRIQTSR